MPLKRALARKTDALSERELRESLEPWIESAELPQRDKVSRSGAEASSTACTGGGAGSLCFVSGVLLFEVHRENPGIHAIQRLHLADAMPFSGAARGPAGAHCPVFLLVASAGKAWKASNHAGHDCAVCRFGCVPQLRMADRGYEAGLVPSWLLT